MQVYKGRLRGSGAVVAVKVQRPGVRESIALDIYILRIILTQVLLFLMLAHRTVDLWESLGHVRMNSTLMSW